MRLRVVPALSIAFCWLSIASSLPAQAQPSKPPTVGDLKEEQRIIGYANLGDAEFQMKTARERLGAGNQHLAQQSGLWALEQIAYAKRRLERHAPRIEEAQGIFGRAFESTRKELRESYAKLRERYSDDEERLDGLAATLQKAGLPLLAETLNNVRGSSGDGAVDAVKRALQTANLQGRGDQAGGDSGGSTTAPMPMSGGNGASQIDANTVSLNGVSLPGQLNGDKITGTPYGTVDLSSGQTNANGVHFYQTDKGVLVIPPGTLIAGAKLNPDGTITFKDGSTSSINAIKAGPGNTLAVTNPTTGATAQIDPNTGLPMSGGAGGAAAGFQPKPGDTYIDAKTGKRITVGPDWDGNKQSGVSKEYIGGAGATLVSETKVVREIVGGTTGEWKVQETPGESRSWNFSIRMGDQQNANGAVTLTLTVDGGGTTGFKIKTWEIADDKGNHASVTPSATNPAEAVVTFAKGGEYSFTATGETDWGSPFKVKGQGGVYP